MPNRYVLQFFFTGAAFHIISGFSYVPVSDLLIATFSGAGFLLVIRTFGNRYYGTDTLGLGDVKLIGASGIWLGCETLFLAITLGALFGVLHGLGVKLFFKESCSFKTLSIPAGPGFILGIITCAVFKFFPVL